MERGACSYVDDRKDGSKPHGACWIDLCQDLEVVDVPGDHFSLLRQSPKDMSIIINILKKKLSAFGWREQIVRSRKEYRMTADEMKELDRYLEDMGVKDNAVRAKLQGALPWTDFDSLVQTSASTAARPSCIRLNSSLTSVPEEHPTVFVLHDAIGSLAGLRPVFAQLSMECYGLMMPEEASRWRELQMEGLAKVFLAAIYTKAPSGPYMICGIGLAGVLAHEVALQLNQRRAGDVEVLLLVEDLQLREAWSMVHQPWFKLYPLVESNCPDVDLEEFLSNCTEKERDEDWAAQVDYVMSLEPVAWNSEKWSAAVEEVLRASSRSGYGWEETITQWCALHTLIQRNADSPKIPLRQFLIFLTREHVLEAQLEFLGSLKPSSMAHEAWDNIINQTIAKISHFKVLSSRYRAAGLFSGATIFLHWDEQNDMRRLMGGWAAGCFRSIAPVIQPVAMKRLPIVSSTSAASIASEIESELHSVVRKLQMRALHLKEIPKQSHAPVQMRMLNDYGHAEKTVRSILDTSEGVAEMTTSLPIWVIHDEQGSTSGHIQALCASLRCPCYGLELNTISSDHFPSLDHLAQSYVSLLQKIQSEGPYMILGVSMCGCMVAHGVASILESQQSQPVYLILLDGSCRRPAVSLHRPTWYSLFFALRDVGALKLGIGDFVEHVKTGTTPSEQLRRLRTFKPDIADEAWNHLIFNAMHKANVLEKLMKAHLSQKIFRGPVGMLLPEDRLGSLFLTAARAVCQGTISYTPIELGHTELLLTSKNRKVTSALLTQTISSLLEM